MKRIAIFCDGTWNKAGGAFETNVVRLAEAVKDRGADGVPQMVIYARGVGTGRGSSKIGRWIDQVFGGLFGWGLEENIIDVYRSLVLCYEPGDEVYIFGFSRGAYTARSLIGLIRSSGLVPRWNISGVEEAMNHYRSRDPLTEPSDPKSIETRARFSPVVATSQADVDYRTENFFPDIELLKLRYVGVWDTVGANGLPGVFGWVARLWNTKYAFHDQCLSSLVQVARHAVAIDERRKLFPPTLWTPPKGATDPALYQQLWFTGDHAAVGGGGDTLGLSHITMEWIAEGAVAQDLSLHKDVLRKTGEGKDPMAPIRGHSQMGVLGAVLAYFTTDRTGLDGADVECADIAPSAQLRMAQDEDYRPQTIRHCAPSDEIT